MNKSTRDRLAEIGKHVVLADKVMEADPSFSDTFRDVLRDLAERADGDAMATGNPVQEARLGKLSEHLLAAADGIRSEQELQAEAMGR